MDSEKALDLFINSYNNMEYYEMIDHLKEIDLDMLIKKTIIFIKTSIPEISYVKSLKFIN